MKRDKKSVIIVGLVLTQLLLILSPALGVIEKVSTIPKKISLSDYGVTVEIPDNIQSVLYSFDLEIVPADTSFPADNKLYVTRAVNINMTQAHRPVYSLLKPVRICFSFNDMDYGRTSNMNTDLPVNLFRIGLWDDNKKQWKQLPSTIYWNGQQGVVETETNFGNGIYALLWSNDPNAGLTPFGENIIRIMVNYNIITPPSPPYIKNSRTMVPLAVIAQNFGFTVNWNSEEKRIDLVKNNETVKLWIGENLIQKGDHSIIIQASPEIYNNYTYVPFSAVAAALGASIEWDPVTITAKVAPK